MVLMPSFIYLFSSASCFVYFWLIFRYTAVYDIHARSFFSSFFFIPCDIVVFFLFVPRLLFRVLLSSQPFAMSVYFPNGAGSLAIPGFILSPHFIHLVCFFLMMLLKDSLDAGQKHQNNRTHSQEYLKDLSGIYSGQKKRIEMLTSISLRAFGWFFFSWMTFGVYFVVLVDVLVFFCCFFSYSCILFRFPRHFLVIACQSLV